MRIVPARKELDAARALSLAKRGVSADAGIRTSEKSHLPNIGDSGKCVRERDGSNFISPPTADNQPNPFKQGFTLTLDGDSKPRPLDLTGWEKVAFTGRWPLGLVDYSDPSSPVSLKLESWTPFIPLATDDSSMPVTLMEYTVENRSGKSVKGRLAGLWENPVLIHSRQSAGPTPTSRVLRENGRTILLHQPTEDAGTSASAGDCGTAALTLLGDSSITKTNSTDQLGAGFQLQPGEKTTFRFLLTWHFPNMKTLPGVGKQAPHHTTRFADAAAVARHVADRFDELRAATMRWVATWNDSTLPQWLLDRSILTTNTLQTTNRHVFADRRFWAWEGVGCCPGTCVHVWHYAQVSPFVSRH